MNLPSRVPETRQALLPVELVKGVILNRCLAMGIKKVAGLNLQLLAIPA